MNANKAVDNNAFVLTEEDRFRVGSYSLLAALLRSTPDKKMLCALGDIDLDTQKSTDMILAWDALKWAAHTSSFNHVDDEFHDLFIGLGKGEIVPYGSWYMTGFLMEKPLGVLRQDLAAMGFEREQNVCEPEDHVAALMEVMTMMINSPDISVEQQKRFFNDHIAIWMERFFSDLETAQSARFYRSVAGLGKTFIKLEQTFLNMPV